MFFTWRRLTVSGRIGPNYADSHTKICASRVPDSARQGVHPLSGKVPKSHEGVKQAGQGQVHWTEFGRTRCDALIESIASITARVCSSRGFM